MCATCGCNYTNWDHEMAVVKGDNPAPNNKGVEVPPMPRQGSENPK
jgi:hypothetical protein